MVLIVISRCLALMFQKIADLLFLVSLNNNIFIRRYLRLMRVSLKGRTRVGHDVYIRNLGNLELGNNCCLGSFTKIWNYSMVTIGDDFMTAGNLTINTASHNIEDLMPFSKPIKIGKNVWCGVNVTILSGVTIGNDVVIGANSLVNKDVPDNTIVAGVPAKAMGSVIRTKDTKMYDPFSA